VNLDLFCRLIKSSLTNSLILYNMVNEGVICNKKFAKSVARSYSKKSASDLKSHLKIRKPERRQKCAKCLTKTIFYCFEYKKHFCDICFRENYELHVKKMMQYDRICKARNDCKQRIRNFCQECNKTICNFCYDKHHLTEAKKIWIEILKHYRTTGFKSGI